MATRLIPRHACSSPLRLCLLAHPPSARVHDPRVPACSAGGGVLRSVDLSGFLLAGFFCSLFSLCLFLLLEASCLDVRAFAEVFDAIVWEFCCSMSMVHANFRGIDTRDDMTGMLEGKFGGHLMF